jgi:uncharacterized SAM-binding protein YcdF (DUF218 family)
MSISATVRSFLIALGAALILYPTYQFISIRSQNHTTTVARADVIVILGAAVWPGGGPSLVLGDRIARAAELYHQGVAPKIICTGGVGTYPPAEAEVEKQLLIRAGVPEAAIITETASTSTAEQARLIKALCDQYGFRSIALVTSFYHERRAMQLFRAAGLSQIEDARCTHNRFIDLNSRVAREAVGLTIINWWHWMLMGLGLWVLMRVWKALRK